METYLNALNFKRMESHDYATFAFFLKVIHGDYLIITVNFPLFVLSSKARASFLFRDTIKLLGEFKLRHPHTRILQTFFFCCFFFSFIIILCLFQAFFLFQDRSVYLLIHSICVLPSASQKYI